MSRRKSQTQLESAIEAIEKEINAATYELAVLQGTRERLRALKRRALDDALEPGPTLDELDATLETPTARPNGRQG